MAHQFVGALVRLAAVADRLLDDAVGADKVAARHGVEAVAVKVHTAVALVAQQQRVFAVAARAHAAHNVVGLCRARALPLNERLGHKVPRRRRRVDQLVVAVKWPRGAVHALHVLDRLTDVGELRASQVVGGASVGRRGGVWGR